MDRKDNIGLPMDFNKKLSRFEILILGCLFCGILLLVFLFLTKGAGFFKFRPGQIEQKEEATEIKTEENLKGKFFLTPEAGNFSVGQVFIVSVWADTGGVETDAADVELTYDPSALRILNLKKGDIFDEYPQMIFDDGKGTIIIRGIDLPGKTFLGNGKVGEITFRAQQAGETQLSFDFQKGVTTDSNLVESGAAKDILGLAKGAEFVIK
jgi:hypothetical protein